MNFSKFGIQSDAWLTSRPSNTSDEPQLPSSSQKIDRRWNMKLKVCSSPSPHLHMYGHVFKYATTHLWFTLFLRSEVSESGRGWLRSSTSSSTRYSSLPCGAKMFTKCNVSKGPTTRTCSNCCCWSNNTTYIKTTGDVYIYIYLSPSI